MLDYAYGNFSKVSVTLDTVEAEGLKAIEENSYVMLPEGVSFEQLDCRVETPMELGDKTGKAVYTYGGHPVGEFETTITDKYYNKLHGIKEPVKEEKPKEESSSDFSTVLKLLIVVVLVIVVLFAIILGIIIYRRELNRKRRSRKIR